MKKMRDWLKTCPLWYRPTKLPIVVSISWKLAAFNFDQTTTLPKLDETSGVYTGYFHRNLHIEGEMDYHDDPNSATLTLTMPPQTASLALKHAEKD